MMDFKEVASKCFPNKSLFADAALMWEIILNIETALKEAHSLGVKQGRGEQREVDLKIVRSWKAFYKSMQDKSKLGEKDGLYRFFAADDIEKEILSTKE